MTAHVGRFAVAHERLSGPSARCASLGMTRVPLFQRLREIFDEVVRMLEAHGKPQ